MTQYEQIWRFIKDHPDCSVAQMAKAFGRTEKAVGGDCWSLSQRKMIVGAKFKPLHGWPYLTYRVNATMREYELLPKPLKRRAAASAPVSLAAPALAATVPESAQAPAPAERPSVSATDVSQRMSAIAESLTLAEARVLQSILNGVLRQ